MASITSRSQQAVKTNAAAVAYAGKHGFIDRGRELCDAAN